MMMPSFPTSLRIACAAPKEEHSELPMLVQICERVRSTGVEVPIYQLNPEDAEDFLVLGLLDVISLRILIKTGQNMTGEQFWSELHAIFRAVDGRTEDRE